VSALDCRLDLRRGQVRQHGLNGLDYLEVSDDQLQLTVFFLGKAPDRIEKGNLVVEGGRSVRGIMVTDVVVTRADDAELDNSMTVTVDKYGDFAPYTLRVVEADEHGRPTDEPLHDFDPRYDRLEFNFKIDCPSELDCKTEEVCEAPERPEPPISYLAKDYASFRQLALDRLALVAPGWQERHAADVGIALVELLAYMGDQLSYYQDAVATEAYLATARRRISVRRHARLVDYVLHEGCNARAWVCVETPADFVVAATEPVFLTGFASAGSSVVTTEELGAASPSSYESFEPLAAPDAQLEVWRAHNRIGLYSWGEAECCLPLGATRATLRDEWREPEPPPAPGPGYEGSPPDENEPAPPRRRLLERLAPGDVLVFVEETGPRTGSAADADPTHRHPVLLTRAEPALDPLYDQPVVEVEWARDDALPFPLCLSARTDECELVEEVSVALGNAILVEHGRRRREPLGKVPSEETPVECDCAGRPGETGVVALPFRPPALQDGPLTFSEPLEEIRSATGALAQNPRRAVPRITLQDTPAHHGVPPSEWRPVADLLRSGPADDTFVVEVDDEGRAWLRFGDGELGRAPAADDSFAASYRIGNGERGNVGVDAIGHVLFSEGTHPSDGLEVRNPLRASGGLDPEPVADVRLLAADAFRTELARAVTAADYATIAQRDKRLQRAAAGLEWTGSWYEARVAVDPLGTEDVDPALLHSVEDLLYPFKRIGHDLEVVAPHYAPLDLALTVCLAPHALRGAVRSEILAALSARRLTDGRLGLFHPDNESFAGGIASSVIVAAVQSIAGVESVVVTRLQRLGGPPGDALERGLLQLGTLEIPRLDNDPSFPGNGRLVVNLEGGR
jgi:hypothetical protein